MNYKMFSVYSLMYGLLNQLNLLIDIKSSKI